MEVYYRNLGTVGWVPDLAPIAIPASGFSSVRNIRFSRLGAELMKFASLAHEHEARHDATAVFCFQLENLDYTAWVSCTPSSIYVSDGDAFTQVGSGFVALPDVEWSGGQFGKWMVLNNGRQAPVTWTRSETSVTPLANWPVGVTAKELVPYKAFLVALNIREEPTDTGATPLDALTATAGGSWVDKDNVLVDDTDFTGYGVNQTFTTTGTLDVTQLDNLSIVLPANSIVVGVEVTIKRRAQNTNGFIRDHTVELLGLTGSVENKAKADNWVVGTFETIVYGGPLDKWGNALTLDEVRNNAFGVRFRGQVVGGNPVTNAVQVQWIGVKIYFESTTESPTMVWWSAPADPGFLPPDWDYSSGASLSGRYEISETSGRCVTARQLGDALAIYKSDAIWMMNLTNSSFVFQFYAVTNSLGVESRRHVTAFPGGHIFLTDNDLYILQLDGKYSSIAEGRVRHWLQRRLNAQNIRSAFLVTQLKTSEVLVCLPSELFAPVLSADSDDVVREKRRLNSVCRTALVWNWATDTFSFRDIPPCRAGAAGPFKRDDSPVTWGDLPDEFVWDMAGEQTWISFALTEEYSTVELGLAGTNTGNLLYALDLHDNDVGVVAGHLERRGLPLRVTRDGVSFESSGNKILTDISIDREMSPRVEITYRPIAQRMPHSDAAYGVSRILLPTRRTGNFASNSNIPGLRVTFTPAPLELFFCRVQEIRITWHAGGRQW